MVDAANACRDDAKSHRWYVVHTKAHEEHRAVEHLQRQGFRVFCPRYRKTIRHARKATSTLAPLFPKYMFVSLDISRDAWRTVNGTRGVVGLIAQADTPLAVPAGIVESLQARMSADGAIDWAPSLKIGQAVRISDGPFTDLLGTLLRLNSAGRVRVLLDLFGQSVSVTVRCDALMPAA